MSNDFNNLYRPIERFDRSTIGGMDMALFKSFGENREKHLQQVREFLFEGEQVEKTYGLINNEASP